MRFRVAAAEALEKWDQEDRPAEAEFTYYPPKTKMFDPETGACLPNFTYGYSAEVVDLEVDTLTVRDSDNQGVLRGRCRESD